MSSSSERGHVKNVANLETMISFCTSYGTAYNPSNELLTVPALNNLLLQSRTSLSETGSAKNLLDLAINERQTEAGKVKPTATRIINALEASTAPKKTVEDAKSINKKIQGRRASAKPEQDEEKRTISTSQQSFDNMADNFSKLVDFVASEPAYIPNEEELKVETLKAYIQQLQTTNTSVINANTTYRNALISRNNTLYAADTGLVDTALSVKKYLKSVFGATSPQFTQVNKLKFTRLV